MQKKDGESTPELGAGTVRITNFSDTSVFSSAVPSSLGEPLLSYAADQPLSDLVAGSAVEHPSLTLNGQRPHHFLLLQRRALLQSKRPNSTEPMRNSKRKPSSLFPENLLQSQCRTIRPSENTSFCDRDTNNQKFRAAGILALSTGGIRNKTTGGLRKQRFNLYGQPIDEHQLRRHRLAQYRKYQFQVHNFLERPRGRPAACYHVFVYVLI